MDLGVYHRGTKDVIYSRIYKTSLLFTFVCGKSNVLFCVIITHNGVLDIEVWGKNLS